MEVHCSGLESGCNLVHFEIGNVALYISGRIVHMVKGPSKNNFLVFQSDER